MQSTVYETELDPREPVDDIEAFLNCARYDEDCDGEMLMAYLEEHPDAIDCQDSQGRTAVHMSAANGHLGLLDMLFRYNPKPNVQNVEGNTALHFAALNNRVDAARALLQHGWKVNVRNTFGKTVLQVIADKGYNTMETLLEENDETLDNYLPPGAVIHIDASVAAENEQEKEGSGEGAKLAGSKGAAAQTRDAGEKNTATTATATATAEPKHSAITSASLLGPTDVDDVE